MRARAGFRVLTACGTALLIGVGVYAAVPAAAAPSAKAKCTITGTKGPDLLRGTSGDDVICGRAGDDILLGLGGDDVLRGGLGDDTLKGGAGDDELDGGPGDDEELGGPGADSIAPPTRSTQIAFLVHSPVALELVGAGNPFIDTCDGEFTPFELLTEPKTDLVTPVAFEFPRDGCPGSSELVTFYFEVAAKNSRIFAFRATLSSHNHKVILECFRNACARSATPIARSGITYVLVDLDALDR